MNFRNIFAFYNGDAGNVFPKTNDLKEFFVHLLI
jgi:hypothetical protein